MRGGVGASPDFATLLRVATAPARVDVGPPVAKHDEPKADGPPNPRRLKITMKTLTDYGFTEGCPQCEHIQRFSETKPGLNHWEKCRQRIIDAMLATPEGSARPEKSSSSTGGEPLLL